MRSRTGFGLRAIAGASIAVAVALTVAVGGTANAATSGDTTVTFTVTAAGGLAITVPASKALNTSPTGTAPGAPVSAQLGTVTVTDSSAALAPTWTASVISGAFTTGTATTAETIPATAVKYWSGATTSTTPASGMTFVPGQLLAANAVAIDTLTTAMSLTAGAGSNAASWNPTLIVAIPAGAVAGLYTGTVTHSVA